MSPTMPTSKKSTTPNGTYSTCTLEKAAAMANHASTRTTQLYDRRCNELSLDEVERIII
jgi:hypothetical protein